MLKPYHLWNFFSAVTDLYIRAGGKLLPLDEVKRRFDICATSGPVGPDGPTSCEHLTSSGCDLCGCCTNKRKTLFNKLAYPTQSCPDNPPRWKATE